MKNYKFYLLFVFILIPCFQTSLLASDISEWNSNFERMFITQKGNNISGQYDYAGGKIIGVLEGRTLKGWWSEDDDAHECGPNDGWSGPFVLKFSTDGKSFAGSYGKCTRGQRTLESINPSDATWTGTLAKGSINFNMLQSVASKSSVSQAKSVTKISLIPEKSFVSPGQPITVTFSGLPAKGQDWLAISDVNHGADEYFDMIMLEGNPKSGTHSFTGLSEGNYEIRAYTNWPDGGYNVTAKVDIKVAKASSAPKPAVARVATPKKPVSPLPAKSLPSKSVTPVKAKPIDGIEPVTKKVTPGVSVLSNNPPLKAPDAPNGLGVDVPSRSSWMYSDLGLLTLDEIIAKFNIPTPPPVGDWRVTERNNGMHVVTQIIDRKTKNFKIKKKFEFKNGKVIRIITGTPDGNQIKIYFDAKTGLLSSAEHRLNEVSNGPRYTYNPDGTPKCVYGYKAQNDAYMNHGRRVCSVNGVLQYERFYENDKETGTWKQYKNGKLAKLSTYKNGKKNGIQATYNNGQLVSWYIAKDGKRVGDMKTP